jgi:hypothetical protein
MLRKPHLEWAERRPISIPTQAAIVHLRARSIEPTWPRVAVGARICSRRGSGSDFSRELGHRQAEVMRTQTTPTGMLVPARRSPHGISRGFAESDPVPTTQPPIENLNATETVGPTKND